MINKVEKITIVDYIFYKVTYSSGIITQVPNDEANLDYQAIQEWIAEGNTVIDNPPSQ